MSTLILLNITMAEVLTIFLDADARIKGAKIRHDETKQYILPMTPPFFLRDIICLTKIQVVLNL